MGPPSGSCTPDSSTPKPVCSDTNSKPAHETGRDQHGNNSHSGSKRSAQHAEYHSAETKRRKEGAERAAKVQKRATQLVQQLAAPDGQSILQETSGTLAKAEDRQNTYNMSIDSKPWARGKNRVSQSVDPTAGLPMRTGHYSDTDTSGGEPSADPPQDAAADGSAVEQPNPESLPDHGKGNEGQKVSEDDRAIEQTNSEPSSDDDEVDKGGEGHSEAGPQSPPTSGGASFSCTQGKHAGQTSPDKAAIKDRQMDEQTHQNHPQNRSESGMRCVGSCYLNSGALLGCLHHMILLTHAPFALQQDCNQGLMFCVVYHNVIAS